MTLQEKINALLAKIPADQQTAASALMAQYGSKLFEMAQEDAWQNLRRIMAGDLNAVSEMDAKLTDAAWLTNVTANTAAWANVANYNIVRDKLKNEILLKVASIAVAILLALVGL